MNTPERLWRTQFNQQLTNQMMERVLKQTIALIARMEQLTPWRDYAGADDRLQAAIVKTLDGTLKWDPERVDLERFFLGAIAGDISHELEHSDKFPHDSLEDEDLNLDDLEDEAGAALASQRTVKGEVPKKVWWSQIIDELRTLADGDIAVLAMLDAYDHGAFTKRDVMAYTKLSSRQYHAAYQRLLRIAKKVDGDVRELVLKAIA